MTFEAGGEQGSVVSADSAKMTPKERSAVSALSALFCVRMLGLFLVLPVLAIAARQLRGGTNLTLVGLALGAYGLTQAFFQIPLGLVADRVGRKPIIAAGLVVFALGSLIAADAHGIVLVIIGRAVQGMGAVSATLIALAADFTRENHRTKAMAIVGSSVGLAFALSLVFSPVLFQQIGLSGLFLITAGLAVLGLLALYTVVPEAPLVHAAEAPVLRDLPHIFKNRQFVRLAFGIFVLNLCQVALFIVFPPALERAGLQIAAQWQVYLPALVASLLFMIPAVWYADGKGKQRQVLQASVFVLLLAEVALAVAPDRLWVLGGLLVLFFAAFNTLEALLPSLLSRVAPAGARATALAGYQTMQTLGLFVGGLVGGWLAHASGAPAVFTFGAVVAGGWLVATIGTSVPLRTELRSTYVGT